MYLYWWWACCTILAVVEVGCEQDNKGTNEKLHYLRLVGLNSQVMAELTFAVTLNSKNHTLAQRLSRMLKLIAKLLEMLSA